MLYLLKASGASSKSFWELPTGNAAEEAKQHRKDQALEGPQCTLCSLQELVSTNLAADLPSFTSTR